MATGDPEQHEADQARLLREVLRAQADTTARLASLSEMLEEILRRLPPGPGEGAGEPG